MLYQKIVRKFDVKSLSLLIQLLLVDSQMQYRSRICPDKNQFSHSKPFQLEALNLEINVLDFFG